jgi:hypothetical protein
LKIAVCRLTWHVPSCWLVDQRFEDSKCEIGLPGPSVHDCQIAVSDRRIRRRSLHLLALQSNCVGIPSAAPESITSMVTCPLAPDSIIKSTCEPLLWQRRNRLFSVIKLEG